MRNLRLDSSLGLLLLLCGMLGAWGCGGESPADADPGGGGDGPQDVERATLSVTVRVAGQDQAVAAKLGFTSGVPGVEVEIEREGTGERFTAVSDGAGRVAFEELLEGNYRVSGVRLLEAAERGQLTGDDRDVNAFAGGMSVRVDPPGASAELVLTAGRPGSLVISEVWHGSFGLPSYFFGFFLELYNNSDTTIYLDGKLVGKGINAIRDYPKFPCSMYDHLRADPEGVWVGFVFRFPGTGRQYPLAPGRAVVVATDAIDHRELAEGRLDLSGADFEFLGTADVDNPAVPNLVAVSERSCCLGKGLYLIKLDDILVIADTADVDALPRAPHPHPEMADRKFIRLPADRVLDVLTYAMEGFGYPVCPRPINERFDRQVNLSMTGDPETRQALKRRPLFATPEGRLVLLRTRTSSRDFRLGDPDPGVVR